MNVNGVRSLLRHTGFYRRFIKDFSKIFKRLCTLLEKHALFQFYNACLGAFNFIKSKLFSSPIVIIPTLSGPFEIRCDANDYAVGSVLGQRRDKIFWSSIMQAELLTMHIKTTPLQRRRC